MKNLLEQSQSVPHVYERLAVHLLDYVKLPQVAFSILAILSSMKMKKEYVRVIEPFLNRVVRDRQPVTQLEQEAIYEVNQLQEDLDVGGFPLKRGDAFRMWLRYRLMFPDEAITTPLVLTANPVAVKKHGIVYAGPILL
jgi:hypothetical protein